MGFGYKGSVRLLCEPGAQVGNNYYVFHTGSYAVGRRLERFHLFSKSLQIPGTINLRCIVVSVLRIIEELVKNRNR